VSNEQVVWRQVKGARYREDTTKLPIYASSDKYHVRIVHTLSSIKEVPTNTNLFLVIVQNLTRKDLPDSLYITTDSISKALSLGEDILKGVRWSNLCLKP